MIRRGAPSIRILGVALIALATLSSLAWTRARQPNAEYQGRRAKLRAQVDGPVVLFGYTGREQGGALDRFFQEENFYYLTGHDQPGAALILVPEPPAGRTYDGSREILYLPPRDPQEERWLGPRIGPNDPGIAEKTGFSTVELFASLRSDLERLAKVYANFYTLLPRTTDSGYPHRQIWFDWLKQVLPQVNFREVGATLNPMRQIKSPGEQSLLQHAVDVSVEAQLEAMRMMRPGLYEYQVAARMEEIHKSGGCEREAYAPIVAAGFNSTVLHYSALDVQIQKGEVVVLDVAGEYGGYTADITRTLPASGHFTPRQRQIYEVVLGAQNAAIAALKPGMTLGRTNTSTGTSTNSLYEIAMKYLNEHGKDQQGRPLGRYMIHGLGHHLGLDVHDVGDGSRPLEAGMVITIEPGVYLADENLGVRIEDDFLITEDGYKQLTARLPRTVEEIEKIMAEGASARKNAEK